MSRQTVDLRKMADERDAAATTARRNAASTDNAWDRSAWAQAAEDCKFEGKGLRRYADEIDCADRRATR